MFNKMVAVVTLVLFIAGFSGCASIPEQHKGAATGAGIGAATGAAAGAIFGKEGSRTSSAVLGGLVGALIGGAIGHYTYDQKKDRNQTAQTYNYQPSMGNMVRIESAEATPGTVAVGSPIDLKMSYAVLTPTADTDVSVTEIREVRYQGELVGRPEVSVTRRGGTYVSSVPLVLPTSARKGLYNVTMIVQTGNVRDSRDTTFSVQ